MGLHFNISLIAVFKYAEENFPNLLPSISNEIKIYEANLSTSFNKTLIFRYAQAYVLAFSPRDFDSKLNYYWILMFQCMRINFLLKELTTY